MSRLFKANQFAMEAHFRASCVATFAFPTEQLKPLVPAPLVIEAYQGYSFVAAAFVDTKNLRPKGFPSIFGRDFILAGYRIFVDYTDKRGKRLRGLYILGSETNSSTMVRLGNRLSNYAYQWSDLSTESEECQCDEILSLQNHHLV